MEKRNKKKQFKIPSDVKYFTKVTLKKFKKESGDFYDSKKEIRNAYFMQLTDLLPTVVETVIKYGHIPEMKESKEMIFTKLTDEEFVKFLRKQIKKDDIDVDSIELLPNVIYSIYLEAQEQIEAEKAENPDTEVSFDLSDLLEISQLILEKKIKKLKKKGIQEDVAFDILSIIPNTDILKKSQFYHIRRFYNCLYNHAKTKEINFEKLVKVVFKDDYINSLIVFALLERKEKIMNFNDTQKKLFNEITEYCFQTMEEMPKEEINMILKAYVDTRKRDEQAGKDANRRYYISSLPETDYPRIIKSVEKMINSNEDNKKYF